ncbi:response regulator [Sneathiella chinensis]|uniref:DNA-binding response regulator n=1 Tax=Sneathiella chinensis TaxID=349750 RepID=A0ABQ5U2V1_9PROT|nr:response regulator [Sneathiella chinensis]GLQ06239.1 DNA-binding response regulator [Sneathiella chinensis]
MQDNAPHILVVDDDARLASLLKKYLSDNGYRVSAASNAEDAWRKLSGLTFDLIVLDRMMPGKDGLSLARDIRTTARANNGVAILMLTAMAEAGDRIDGLEAGVDDYLTKPFEPRELLLRIEAILRRARQETVSEIGFGPFTFDLTRGELLRDGTIINLTSSEQGLLKTLAANPGVTISRDQLSVSSDTQGRAVDVQITRLRRKIEEDPKNPRYLQTVRGEGYVLWAD